MGNRKSLYTLAILISHAGVIVLAILYTNETNKTITTPELIEELLVEDHLQNVNSEASIDSLSAIQDYIQSEDFKSSTNYLELKGNGTNYIVQFRYEENREIRIMDVDDVANE
ncbi:hypothetical protein [Shouchella shacheensis]|uniref:hypothetical protein n=1 Tax=Shouchella shacheensis TaxID=1649580 RepID=UPI000740199D|nr:hypothetical protein [Shouchella shacheensis]